MTKNLTPTGGNIAFDLVNRHMTKEQDIEQGLISKLEELKYIENESFASTFQGLFLEINLDSEKLGKSYSARNVKLCTIISKIAEGIAGFSASNDVLGDAYE